MLLFNEATKKEFRKLLELISEYELDKQATFEKLNKVDQQKLFKENKKNLKTFLVDKTYKYLLCWDNEKLVGYMFL